MRAPTRATAALRRRFSLRTNPSPVTRPATRPPSGPGAAAAAEAGTALYDRSTLMRAALPPLGKGRISA
ncbi:hypothetical protein GCM10027570_13650 [Streptomonospora sediminis]